MKPQPSTFPISDSFMGVDSQGIIRGVTELYFPEYFNYIKCDVYFFKLKILNFRQAKLCIEFKLTSNQSVEENLYKDEAWKTMSTRNFFQDPFIDKSKIKNPVPTFALMLHKTLVVSSVKLNIDDLERTMFYDQTPDILILPNSYPPLTNLPNEENYTYYDKKSTVFYSELLLDKEYLIEIDLESDLSFQFAPLFPYKDVTISSIDTENESDFLFSPFVVDMSPEIDKKFPDWLEKKMKRMISRDSISLPPEHTPAFPTRGNMVSLVDLTEYLNGSSDFKMLRNKKLTDYKTICFVINIIIPEDKDYEIIVRVTKNPLPPRIYEQINSLTNYKDVLVEYDMINFGKKKMRLRIETEIPGYTEKLSKVVYIHTTNNERHKKARTRFTHCPQLKRGIIDNLTRPEKSKIHCKITDEEEKRVIFEDDYNIELLSHDQIIWSLKDVRGEHSYNLAEFIGAWIHPTDQNRLIDSIRSGATKYLPGFGGYTETLEDKKNHFKAVFKYLSEDLKIKYVNQPFTSRPFSGSQRVLLPEDVIKNKSGNCIDLVILFASILEGVGIYSLIFLIPGHAFIGCGNSRKTDEMMFLEATFLGRFSFEEALKKGEEEFRKEFLSIGSDDPLPNFITFFQKGCQIIDLEKVRNGGIVSRRL